MTDITDKYEKYKVPYSTNEKHSPDEFDPKENGGLDNPANRHKDKLLDDICDTHPGSPMCKVFDCWTRLMPVIHVRSLNVQLQLILQLDFLCQIFFDATYQTQRGKAISRSWVLD